MSGAAVTLVDAHAHLHPCFPLEVFLEGAWENFSRAAAAIGRPLAEGVLLLAQLSGDERFEVLAAQAALPAAGGGRAPAWALEPTAEGESLVARRGEGARLVLVCGRQIRTREGLEVLALASGRRFEDGTPAAQAIAAAFDAHAIPVLPWGVGKWLGSRGRVVRGLIDQAAPGLCCGDSANRPRFWPRPRLLTRAAGRGLRVLPGSDPLPLPSEAARAGRFGLALAGPLSAERPAAELAARLADPVESLCAFGRLESPLRFAANQLALRRRGRSCR